MVDAILAKARDNPGFANLDTDLKLNTPQLKVSVDRDKAADVGVEVESLGRTLETLLGGRQVTRFKRDGEQYDVVVQVADIDRRNPEDLRRIYVRGHNDTMVPLGNLVSIKEQVAPKELNHFNQLRAATISAHLAPGYTIGEGLSFLEDAARDVIKGKGQIDYAGQSREFRESTSEIYVTFLLALGLHLPRACRRSSKASAIR